MMRVVAGIDYSMTSPSICVHGGDQWSPKNCTFYYLVPKKKHLVTTSQLKGHLYPEWSGAQERFDMLAAWSIAVLSKQPLYKISLEGYSYGSKGTVFQIGENTGILKDRLWRQRYDFEAVPPTVVKKIATGKGNSNKEAMWVSFLAETGIDLFSLLGQEQGKNWNPVSDIVDAYYLAKCCFQSCQDNKETGGGTLKTTF
jgi:Holliday junction resolvasome RuvABC endonuclease subunit